MNRKYLALTIVVVGVIVYFYPLLQQFANSDSNQFTGVIFVVGGAILFYLPSKSTGGKSKK